MNNKRRNESKRIALGGICTALAFIIMLAGGFLPVSTFSAPILSSLFIIPLVVEWNRKTALIAFAAVSVLSILILPDKEVALFFILLTGYYPTLQPSFQKLKAKPLRILLKLVLFNLALFVLVILLLFVLVSPAMQESLGNYALQFWVFAVVLGNVLFILYDILVANARLVYINRIRKRLF